MAEASTSGAEAAELDAGSLAARVEAAVASSSSAPEAERLEARTCNMCGELIRHRLWACSDCVDLEFCEECHSSGISVRKRGYRDAGKHTAAHQMLCRPVEHTLPTILCGSLKQVVDNAAQRWFWECLRQAKLGDAQNQMLVSQMYLEGYGIAVSESKSTYWKLTARANGARRLEGVYDRLE